MIIHLLLEVVLSCTLLKEQISLRKDQSFTKRLPMSFTILEKDASSACEHKSTLKYAFDYGKQKHMFPPYICFIIYYISPF